METKNNKLSDYETGNIKATTNSETNELFASIFLQMDHISNNNSMIQNKANDIGYYNDPQDEVKSSSDRNDAVENANPTIVYKLKALQNYLINEVKRSDRIVRQLNALV